MYDILIHLTGCSCSGKSTVQTEFKDDPRVTCWDIVKFYNDEKIIIDGEMNWDNYRNKIWKLNGAFNKFIEGCNTPVVIVETIGWNEYINDTLEGMAKTTTIVLATPPLKELQRRIKKRSDIREETVMYFYNIFIKSELNNKEIQLQPSEAYMYISGWVNSYELETFQNRAEGD